MNVDYNNINLSCGNVLTHPDKQHLEFIKSEVGFDIIVANPPYSQKWHLNNKEDKVAENDPRFKGYDGLTLKSRSDLAFIQHMLYYLKKDGICVVALPHGVLFRDGIEKTIRQQIIKNNYIDTIINLPTNIFFNMDLDICIIVFKKQRTDQNILFIEASQECGSIIQSKKNKNILNENNINDILNWYFKRENVINKTYIASQEEIIKHDYDLMTFFKQYINSSKEEEVIDYSQLKKEEHFFNEKMNEYKKIIELMVEELE